MYAGSKGNGVRIPDRTAAVWASGAQMPLAQAEKARGAMNPSQKTCLRTKYRFLRPQERYVLRKIPGRIAVAAARLSEHASMTGYTGLSRYIPIFMRAHRTGTRRRGDPMIPTPAREVPFPLRLPPVAVAKGIKKPSTSRRRLLLYEG